MGRITKIVSIDPGTYKCGLAVLWRSKDEEILVQKTLLVAGKEKESFFRCLGIAHKVADFVRDENPDVVICEYPHKGGPGMASKSITILFHFCGMLHALVDGLSIPIKFFTPMKWKGNKPKALTQQEVHKKYGINNTSEDIIDAIGLGDWFFSTGAIACP